MLRSKKGKRPTRSQLKKLLGYDPDTGIFRWRIARPIGGHRSGNKGIKAGAIAGWIDSSIGYRKICIAQRDYYAHHLAWFLMTGRWPIHQIDHRNMNPSDNRFSNLRQATKAQNMRNRLEQKNNTSGMRGVFRMKRNGIYFTYIKVDKTRINLGCFKKFEDAVAARLAAEVKYYGEYRPQ